MASTRAGGSLSGHQGFLSGEMKMTRGEVNERVENNGATWQLCSSPKQLLERCCFFHHILLLCRAFLLPLVSFSLWLLLPLLVVVSLCYFRVFARRLPTPLVVSLLVRCEIVSLVWLLVWFVSLLWLLVWFCVESSSWLAGGSLAP
jgi:hypothetical protein